MTTFVADYRPIFILVTFGFLGTAFYLTYRPQAGTAGAQQKNEKGKASPSRHARPFSRVMAANKIMLWAVTIVAVVFLFFPQAYTSLFNSGDDVTPEMQQTVVSIEGMT